MDKENYENRIRELTAELQTKTERIQKLETFSEYSQELIESLFKSNKELNDAVKFLTEKAYQTK